MRFDSPEHLEAWERTKLYPRIHDPIAQMIVSEIGTSARVLDLGCSYGLLADRIAREARAQAVFGVDRDAEVIKAGRDAEISAQLFRMDISADNFSPLVDLIRQELISALVARRVLPELFGDNVSAGCRFAAAIAAAGVKQVFIEGRVVSARSVNPLKSVGDEVTMLSCAFEEIRRVGGVSYLESR